MDRELCRALEEAIRDESEAIRAYRRLQRMLPDPQARRLVWMIRRDEMGHRRVLEDMLARYCRPR